MASTFTPSLNLELPGRNDYQNQWDVPTNGTIAAIDARFAAVLTVPLSNADVVLTQAQARCASIVLTGALVANVNVYLPAGCGGFFSILNGTTGNFTTALRISPASGAAAGAAVTLPAGRRFTVISDGVNAYFSNPAILPGMIFPWLGQIVPPDFILPYGQVLSQAAQPGIYAAYGTTFNTGNEAANGNFRMPDLRGRIFAGLDNMGGSAANILTSFSGLGATGGEQAHALSQSELAAHAHGVNDYAHTHGVGDPAHAHPYNQTNQYNVSTSGSGGQANLGLVGATTGGSLTGIYIGGSTTGISIQSAGGNVAHNNLQPTMLGNWIVKT